MCVGCWLLLCHAFIVCPYVLLLGCSYRNIFVVYYFQLLLLVVCWLFMCCVFVVYCFIGFSLVADKCCVGCPLFSDLCLLNVCVARCVI